MLGPSAESRAARFLARQGLRLLARNFRTRWGEIDLVALDGPTVCIVEVRARAPGALVSAFESIGPAKRRRIERAALEYLQRNRLGNRPIRFDVVAVTGNDLKWLKGAFEAST